MSHIHEKSSLHRGLCCYIVEPLPPPILSIYLKTADFNGFVVSKAHNKPEKPQILFEYRCLPRLLPSKIFHLIIPSFIGTTNHQQETIKPRKLRENYRKQVKIPINEAFQICLDSIDNRSDSSSRRSWSWWPILISWLLYGWGLLWRLSGRIRLSDWCSREEKRIRLTWLMHGIQLRQ